MIIRILTVFTCAVGALTALVGVPQAEAQAPRSVLLRLCNDAPFNAGVMAAYQTGASPDRTLQGWFLVPAGECLEGGIDSVAGGQIGLHAMSGEWRWPVYDLGMEFCTPANGGRRPGASGPPCGSGDQVARFQPVSINHFQSGWGVVDYRFGCADFAASERALCDATPRDGEGMAVPVRELEVCNRDRSPIRVAIGFDEMAGQFHVEGWREIDVATCETVYRGFPGDNRIYIRTQREGQPGLEHDIGGNDDQRFICQAQSAHFNVSAPRIGLVNPTSCPAGAPEAAYFQEIIFGPRTAHFIYTIRPTG